MGLARCEPQHLWGTQENVQLQQSFDAPVGHERCRDKDILQADTGMDSDVMKRIENPGYIYGIPEKWGQLSLIGHHFPSLPQ